MREDCYLNSYWESRLELAPHEEPPYNGDERPNPNDYNPEDGFPFTVTDLSDDGDALASVWGPEDDCGGYWEE